MTVNRIFVLKGFSVYFLLVNYVFSYACGRLISGMTYRAIPKRLYRGQLKVYTQCEIIISTRWRLIIIHVRCVKSDLPSVLRDCWLDNRKCIRPVKIWIYLLVVIDLTVTVSNLTRFASQVTELLLRNRALVIYLELFRASCRKNYGLDRKMMGTFYDGYDVLYHRAMFGRDRTTRAGCT